MKYPVFSKRTFISVLTAIGVVVLCIVLILACFGSTPIAKTQAVAVKSVSSQIQADGAIAAQDQATLHFQTSGKLVYLPVKEGDSVKQGQTIASLDTTTIQKQITQALNTYKSTRDTYDQTIQNQGNNVLQNTQKTTTGQTDSSYLNDVAKRIVDQNQANLDNAVLNVEIAQQALQLSTLISPLNGVITHMDVTTSGVNVLPTTTFTVADPSTLVFRVNVAESDIDYIAEGSVATIKLSGAKKNEFFGHVDKIYPDKITLSSGQKVYQVDIASSDFANYGKMGQTGTVLIQSNFKSNAQLVPTWTVLDHDSIWVLSGDKTLLRHITVGKMHGDMIEVLDGLEEGDQVITNPQTIAAQKYQIL